MRNRCLQTLAAALGLCLASCGPLEQEAAAVLVRSPSRQRADCAAPVRVAIVQDRTESREGSLTPVLDGEDLRPLFDLLRACGGEVRVGEVIDLAPGAFTSLRIELPPVFPVEPAKWPANPFARAEARAAWQKELSRAETARRSWLAESEARVAQFRAAFEARWAGRALARRSDVWSAIDRASLFLQEPNSGDAGASRHWLLVLSDGEHNTGRPARFPEIGAETQLIVVNSAGRVGDLARLNPKRFEALDAAIRWIAEESTRGTAGKETSDG